MKIHSTKALASCFIGMFLQKNFSGFTEISQIIALYSVNKYQALVKLRLFNHLMEFHAVKERFCV